MDINTSKVKELLLKSSKEATSTPSNAIIFLKSCGIMSEDGQLSENYK